MIRSDKITVFGQCPSKSNQYQMVYNGKKGRCMMFTSNHYKKWMSLFFNTLLCYKNPKITGHFKLEMTVYYKDNRSDIDNALKGVLDCLQQAKWIKNDNMCRELFITKKISKTDPRIEFVLSSFGEQESLF